MNTETKIKDAHATAKNYPDLASKLVLAGVESYTVDTATGIILYRLAEGETFLKFSGGPLRAIAISFSEMLTIRAVRDNQQGKTDFPGFMNDIAAAGVRFYEAVLTGNRKRVIYIGTGGSYEELIPID